MYIRKGRTLVIILLVGVIFLITLMVISSKNSINKESIIKSFNDNYGIFSDMEKYISEQKSIISVYKDKEEIIFRFDGEVSNTNNSSVNNQAEYIINKLHFESIIEGNGPALQGVIVFERGTTNGLEQGIVYIDDDSGGYGGIMIKIRDRWYYYSIGYV
ncbi:MAG: hypothetical protein K0R09_2880 [Clostridiales bacterium]|nr:hypothetical protein [Clostridiales bacterium]